VNFGGEEVCMFASSGPSMQSLKKKNQNLNVSGGFKGVIESMKFHTKIS
jgi:hypothetical protein